ncbi:uncharacterized protein sowahb [Xenentodon cancila]
MATVLTQDSVLLFLQSSGGSVKNADLLLHFRNFLRDHAERDRNRELFKTFVNSVATVRQVDGVSHVVLRKTFRKGVPGGGTETGSSGPRRVPGGSATETEPSQVKAAAPSGEGDRTAVLPAAGIIGKHSSNLKTKLNTTYERPAQAIAPPGPSGGPEPAPGPVSLVSEKRARVPSVPESPAGDRRFVPGPFRHPTPHLPGPVHRARLDPQVSPRRARQRQSYKSAISQSEEDDDDEEDDVPVRRGSAGGMLPMNYPSNHTGKDTSASSPCLTDVSEPPPFISSFDSTTSKKKVPQIYIQPVEGGIRTPCSPSEMKAKEEMERLILEVGSAPGDVTPVVCNLPSEPEGFIRPAPQAPESAPYHDLYWDPGHAQAPESAPYHDLYWDPGHAQAPGAQLQSGRMPDEVRQPASSCRSSLVPSAGAGFSSSNRSLLGSTATPGNYSSSADVEAREGCVYDGAESSEGSISSPQFRQHTSRTRRMSSQLRNRKCLSLGADLDKLIEMDVREEEGGGNEAARLDRLHLISSSLSLRYNLSSSSLSSCATPPRCPSPALYIDGEERGERRTCSNATSLSSVYHSGQPSLPLEPREHAWMIKGAAGAWPEIYSLFREDPSLLNRRDFISGFTVLHWIAKHGDHRVLNTLWYGVEKVGLTLDVNAKSTGGQTPLHIAAIHDRKSMMRLLVKKYSADVGLRDTAGKRPWQYLRNTSLEILQLLGAPARAAVIGKADPSLQLQQQRPRLRHHPSTATLRDALQNTTKVKRSSSIAALLKHKSLQRFYGHHSDSPC